MESTITFLKNGYDVLPEVLNNKAHHVQIKVVPGSFDVLVKCSSREALYEFGKALVRSALYGNGEAEFYPLAYENSSDWLVVNGVRLAKNSSRVFVSYPPQGSASNEL
jgi:hypothetical protein